MAARVPSAKTSVPNATVRVSGSSESGSGIRFRTRGFEMGMKRKNKREPLRGVGTSVYTGIAEDIPMPIIRTGRRNIEDVDDAPPKAKPTTT